MDYNNKVIYADSPLLFPEMYKEHNKFYQFPLYQAEFWAKADNARCFWFFKYKTVPNHERRFNMIYAGKELYLKKIFAAKL
jgi:hypothetical protein